MLAALPASAQTRDHRALTLATAAYATATAADLISTQVNCQTVAWTACESDPIMRPLVETPNVGAHVLDAALNTAVIIAWYRLVGHRHPRFAAVGFALAAVSRGWIAGQNIARHSSYVQYAAATQPH